MRSRAHSSHAGRRAWHVRRPWRSRFTWNSSSCAGRGHREHVVVHLLERAPGAEQAQAGADARHVGVDRDVALAVGEQQHAGRRLAARRRAASIRKSRPRRRCVARARRASSASSSRRISWMRADLTFEMPPGRIASSTSSIGRLADGLPAREALAQPQEGDVAVAVVRRLREHGEDQLVESVPVRRRGRDAVDRPQPVADPPHASRDRAAPVARFRRTLCHPNDSEVVPGSGDLSQGRLFQADARC